MSGVKKKQHYVPRFYLRYFADFDNKFYVYDFSRNGVIPDRVYYESQCFKKFFYGEDGVLEEQLSKKEGEWAKACKKAISSDVLSESDCALLKEFVLYQKQRTDSNNNQRIEEREAVLRECSRQLYYHKGWQFDEVAENFCRQRAKEEITPAENVSLAVKMLKYIEDLSVIVVKYTTNSS